MNILTHKEQLNKYNKKHEWITFDLETTSLVERKGVILLLAVTTPEDSFVVDFTKIDIKEAFRLENLFQSDKVINHNITFDIRWWYTHTKIFIPNPVCTMINEYILAAGKFLFGVKNYYSLESVARRRLDKQLSKETRQEFINYSGSLSDQAYIYAQEDTLCIKPIYDLQMEEIKREGLEQTYELECSILNATAFMEMTGVLVDRDQLRSFIDPLQRYIKKCSRMLQDIFIESGYANEIYIGSDEYLCFNPGSRDQKIAALHSVGIHVPSLSTKDLIKWDYKNRKKELLVDYYSLIEKEDEDIAEALDQYGGYVNKYLRALSFLTGAQKLLNSYVIGLDEKIDENGRWYPWFKQCGASATGRYSSNAQQIPKNDKLKRLNLNFSIRECFIASKGRKLIIADYPAIELVILAQRSGDKKLQYEISQGDIHLLVTREVMGHFIPQAKDITEENKGSGIYKLMRDFSKILSYGIGYGVTGSSLAEQATEKLGGMNVKITTEQGDQMVHMWKELFKDAGKYLRDTANNAVTKGYTTSIFGRKRYFDLEEIRKNKWKKLAAEREGCNQSIQSTSADMTKLATQLIFNGLDKSKARVILTIHDELVVEAVNSYAGKAAELVKECMEKAACILLPDLGSLVIVKPAISERYDK